MKDTNVNGKEIDREPRANREPRPPRGPGRDQGARPPRRPPTDAPQPEPQPDVALSSPGEDESERNDVPRAELTGEKLDIRSLKEKSIGELTGIAKALDVANATALRKQELIFEILRAQTEKSGLIFAEGVLETLPDGFGFLRAP